MTSTAAYERRNATTPVSRRTAPGSPARAARTPVGAVQAMQRSAGNAAVTVAIQRLAGGTGLAEPVKPSGVTPQEDPRFRALEETIAGKGTALKQHPSPASEVAKAKKAA